MYYYYYYYNLYITHLLASGSLLVNSVPARSTSVIFDLRLTLLAAFSLCSIMMVKTPEDLEKERSYLPLWIKLYYTFGQSVLTFIIMNSYRTEEM